MCGRIEPQVVSNLIAEKNFHITERLHKLLIESIIKLFLLPTAAFSLATCISKSMIPMCFLMEQIISHFVVPFDLSRWNCHVIN